MKNEILVQTFTSSLVRPLKKTFFLCVSSLRALKKLKNNPKMNFLDVEPEPVAKSVQPPGRSHQLQVGGTQLQAEQVIS